MSRYYLKNGSEVKDLRAARKVSGVPSVTTILNAVCPHEYKFMDSQRLKVAFDDCDGDWDLAVEMLGQNLVFEQGSLLHEAAELFLSSEVKSDPLEIPVTMKQLYLFLSKYHEPVVEEFYYSNKMETGGRVDVWGMLRDDKVMTDYKSCMSFKKKPSKSWLAQMGGYALILEENDIFIDYAEIVQLSKMNEGCSILKISKEDLEIGKEIFIKARSLFKLWIAI